MMKLDVYTPAKICYSLSFVTVDGDPSAFAGHGDAFGSAGTERRRPKGLPGRGEGLAGGGREAGGALASAAKIRYGAPRHPGTPAPRHPGTPAPRHPGTPGTPAPRHPGTPAPRHPGTPAPRHPGTPAPRHPGTPAPRHPNARPPSPARTRSRSFRTPLAGVLAALLALLSSPAQAQTDVWSATLTAGESLTGAVVDDVGYEQFTGTGTGSLSDDDFDLAVNSFTVVRLRIAAPATDNALQFALLPRPGGLASYLTLHLGSDSFPLADATVSPETSGVATSDIFTWTGHGLSWSASDTVAARLTYSPPPPLVPCAGTEGCFQILASSELVPPGISAGSSFRLLFVSSTQRDASSTDIADYNSHVQAAAARGHPEIVPYHPHFTAVGSTADTDARDNTRTTYTASNKGLPIHWLGGSKVADDYADFYDGTWDDEANPKNESGSAQATLDSATNPNVLTGSTDSGTKTSQTYLGTTVFADQGVPEVDLVRLGLLDSDDGNPLDGDYSDSPGANALFYALSPVLKAVTRYNDTYVPSNWALLPDGLGPGDTFRLLFATSTTRDATSTDIADYNDHVQDAAAAGHVAIQAYSSRFTVVGSTAAVDARDNTRTTYTNDDLGLPIYWLNGDKVADQYKDFYDGDWDEEANSTDESGSTRSLSAAADRPFTGSSDDGTASSLAEFGSTANVVRVGQPNSLTSGANPLSSGNAQVSTGSRPFYALSGIFIVGQKITVPSNWGLIPDGLGPGDRFRLLFTSSNSNNADDTGIAAYNTWVQARAAAGHAGIRAYSDGFRVVGSTAAVDAIDNTQTNYTDDDKGVPIYWLNGSKVADDYEDFYDGSWEDEAGSKDASGTARTLSGASRPHTGSGHDGTEAFTGTNSRALGATLVRIGWPDSSDASDGPLSFVSTTSGDVSKFSIRPFYALSAVLEVSPHGVANNAPAFTATPPVTRDLAENTDAGENVGAPVAASDDDTDDSLTYSLRGTDAASFEIVATSGQILTKAEVSYDHETKSSYSVDVRVTDGIATATIAVTITVTDVEEPPAAPAAPAVLPTAGTTDSLDVSWTAPDNTGPAITDYDVQYRAVGEVTWTDLNHTGTALSATISGLDADTHYQVQVRATNGEGIGLWSDPGQAPTRGPPTEVPAEWGLIPDGLGPGDSFRLLFLSSTKRDATSPDIADYNAFVQTAAAAGHADIQAYSAGFAAVGSTAATDARVNTASTFDAMSDDKGPPIYWLGGNQVADDYAGFYDADWDDEANPTNESGSAEPPVNNVGNAEGIFTGSQDDGTASPQEYLGTTEPSIAFPVLAGRAKIGLLDSNIGDPLDGGSPNAVGTENSRRFYALSPVFLVPSEAAVPADWGLLPDGLGPGDSFRLLFATSTTRDASSTDIAVYNTFVQTAAAAGHADIQAYSYLFRVVGSTAAVDARDNTSTTHTNDDTGLPIYWLGGNQVAGDYAGFYDGDWDDEAGSTNESGNARSLSGGNLPFTGSDNAGTADSTYPLGANRVQYGTPNSATAGRRPLRTAGESFPNTDTRPFYALSPVFVVTSDVTVPPDWGLIPDGLAAGDSFRLLFATSTTRDASSTDIADYNSFVQTAAAAGHTDIQAYSAGFRAVGSTAAVDARDNTETTQTRFDTGLPIHWLGGAKVADDYADFYDGDWDDEANPTNESGSARSLSGLTNPWTGSQDSGTEKTEFSVARRWAAPASSSACKPGSSTPTPQARTPCPARVASRPAPAPSTPSPRSSRSVRRSPSRPTGASTPRDSRPAPGSGCCSSPPPAATPTPPTSATTTPSCRPAPPLATPTSRTTAPGSAPSPAPPPPTPATTPRPPARACPSTGSAAPRPPMTTPTSTTGAGTTRPAPRTSPAAPGPPTFRGPAAPTPGRRVSKVAFQWRWALQPLCRGSGG